MQKTCKNCKQNFEITDEDLKFYEKIKVPSPQLCRDCRQQRRLTFRNERYLFKRKCDLCSKDIVSFFDENVRFPVYCLDCFWSDKWDPLSYGQDFNFNKSFFEQFHDLMMKVPKAGMLHLNNENSEYNTALAYSKNTYMSPGCYYVEDCYFVRKSQNCKDCFNSSQIDHCELLSAGLNCNNCYFSHQLFNCKNCSNCFYLANCTGCSNSFMCSGIHNKQYYFKNAQYSKEDYSKILDLKMKENSLDLLREFLIFNQSIPKKYQNQINCENSSGDYIQNSKNAIECYDSFEIEDCKYLYECVKVKDSMDLSLHDEQIELCYELCTGGEKNNKIKFSFCACDCFESEYLYSCFYTSNSFACDGIHSHTEYCILNKKYNKENYENLKKKIIEYANSIGEYGEFLPIKYSLYPYNESVAQDFYPLTKEEALSKKYQWRNKNLELYIESKIILDNDINNISDSILNEILACKDCGKNYHIIAQELNLSRKLKIPLSEYCGDCRYLHLLSLRNPRKLWKRNCMKCGNEIQTTYSSERPEIVYCEKCYLESVY